ncbi:MAG: HAD family hydrolase, partial [Bacillota bacterium]
MNNTRCLLFDLDGTLLDSREPIVDAVYATVQKYQPGMFAREDLLRCFGESFDDFFRRISPELPSGVTREQFFITYLDYMNVYHGKKLKLFPFVREGLEDLKLLGYQLGIVTNKQRELVLEGLQSVNILNL